MTNVADFRIPVHRIEQGQGTCGCDPRGVQVLFKEVSGKETGPNEAYIRELLKREGFKIKRGHDVDGGSLHRLCVGKDEGQVTVPEILQLLEADPEIKVMQP